MEDVAALGVEPAAAPRLRAALELLGLTELAGISALARAGLLASLRREARRDGDPRRAAEAWVQSVALALRRWASLELAPRGELEPSAEASLRPGTREQLEVSVASLFDSARRTYRERVSFAAPPRARPVNLELFGAEPVVDGALVAARPPSGGASARVAHAARSAAGARTRRKLETAERESSALRAELEERERSFRAVAEGSPDLIVELALEPELRVSYANAQVSRRLGIGAEQLLEAIHPLDAPALRKLLTAGGAWPRELRLRWLRPDGGELLTEVVATELNRAGARTLRLVMRAPQQELPLSREARYLEERERLLQRLGGERSWLQAVFAQLPVGVLLVEPDGRVSANPRAERLVGRAVRDASLQPGEQMLTPAGKAVDPEDFPTRRVACGAVFEGLELVLVRADRRRVHVRYSGHPVTDEAGQTRGGVLVMEDVTCQRDHERLLREWSSVVVHDLRQPLAAIEMNADMLRRKPRRLSEEQAGMNISRSAKLMGRLIGDLVDSSQLEANRLSLQLADVDAAAMMEEIVARVDGRVLDKRIHLVRPLPAALVHADAQRLEQVLWNLLTNGAKYGFPGADVELAAELRDNQLHITVSNQGPGLEREALGRLFMRFERMHRTTMPSARGLGLGLYISKGIVEAHHGQIWAESVPNQLTTFHVVLPARAAAQAEAHAG